MAATLTTSLYGPLQQSVSVVLEELAQQRVMARLYDKDPSLWSRDPAVQKTIANRLGWLSIADVTLSRSGEIRALAQQVRAAGLTRALLLGMGGSSLFPEVCRFTFGVSPGCLDVAVLDNTDPAAILAAQHAAPLDKTLFIVSSKSGSTTESSTLCDYFYDLMRRLVGERAGQHFIAITDSGTSLEALASARQFRTAFIHGPATGQDVGGRFSALTCFGMAPAAMMGVDFEQLLGRAKEMLAASRPSVAPLDNPALKLGAALGESARSGRDKVTLLCGKPLSRFGVWAEQLIAECTGKSGTGLVPIDGERLRDPRAYGPDRLFLELQIESEPDAAVAKATEALIRSGAPVVRLHWRDRYDLGAEVMRFFLATAVASHLMKINAFDEPNVKESKDRTKALLDRYVAEKALPDEAPAYSDDGVGVYPDARMPAGRTLQDAVKGWLGTIRRGDYVAIASFLPRTPELDAAAHRLRQLVEDAGGAATMLGFGPRYLHSTGQLHKGGSDRVALLFLTSEDPVDAPIPGRAYTFSVLKRAQALGDYQALHERKRHLLRLHFGRAPESGVPRVLQAFGSAERMAARA